MQDPNDLQQQILQHNEALQQQQAQYEALQQAKIQALNNALKSNKFFTGVDFEDFLTNNDWQNYGYKRLSGGNTGVYVPGYRYRYLAANVPEYWLIKNLRNAKSIDDVKKQSELWDLYRPLGTSSGARDYINYVATGGYKGSNAEYGGSRPVFTTTNGSDSVKTTAGGVQGVQAGNGAARSGTQGSNNGSGGAQGTQGVQAGDTGGIFASSGVPKGGTKTIGYDPYDPNPGNVSLAYAMRNAPEQERRAALINKWNRENGRESVPYVPGTEIPAGSLNRSGSTYASPGISTGGTYATGEGIKDANGNVLTNPGGDWEYQYALKNPQYGLGMMGKMSDAQKNYLQAVSDDMGYKYNFTGATRFV